MFIKEIEEVEELLELQQENEVEISHVLARKPRLVNKHALIAFVQRVLFRLIDLTLDEIQKQGRKSDPLVSPL